MLVFCNPWKGEERTVYGMFFVYFRVVLSCSVYVQKKPSKNLETFLKTSYRPGATRRYDPRRWQFDSRWISVHPRTGPQSAHLWWLTSCR